MLLLLIRNVTQLLDGLFDIFQCFRILKHLILRKKLHTLDIFFHVFFRFAALHLHPHGLLQTLCP